MSKFFRKYSKHLMALASVFLMVSWLATSIGGNGQGGNGTVVVGTIAGQKFTQQEVQTSFREWEMLNSQVFTNPEFLYESMDNLIVRSELTREVGQNIRAHPEIYLALQRDAARMGMTATPDQVKTELTALKLDPDNQELYDAMSHYLAVEHAVQRILTTVKVSATAADQMIATKDQRVAVSVVELPYDSYKANVPEPTTQQIEDQYDKYKSVNPESDEMGFGYLDPNRVELEWIEVPREAVKKAIKIPEVELWKYYKLNGTQFQTTQPSSEPSLSLGGMVAQGPTTRPFTEVRDEIVQTLTDRATDQLSDEIVKDINDQIDADWVVYRQTQHAEGPSMEATTGPSAAKPEDFYAAKDYLQTLALNVQQKQLSRMQTPRSGAPYIQTAAVLPTTDSLPTAEGGEELNKLPGIGQLKPIAGGQITFGQYVLGTSDALISSQSRQQMQQQGIPTRLKFQPSRPITGTDGVYIYRDRLQLGENPGVMQLIRPMVVADARRAQERTLATADANIILKLSAQSGALAPGTHSVVRTGPFDVNSESIPGLALDSKAVKPFIDGVFALLELQKGDAGYLPDRRLGVVDLPEAGSTAIVELKLADVQLTWPETQKAGKEFAAAQNIAARIQFNIVRQWLQYPAVAMRNNIKLAADSTPQPTTPPPPPSGNIPIGQ